MDAEPVGEVICGDSLEVIERLPPVRCVFADPPDNIGLDYGAYKDSMPGYEDWLARVISAGTRHAKIFWLSYYHAHDLVVSRLTEMFLLCNPGWRWRKIIWRFTFGQYRDRGLANGYRPIMMLWRADATVNYDAIRVPSERMLLRDRRAAGPRIPDDVWEIPRVTGNSAQRRAWHPTQHPEELVERILLLSCYPTGRVIDMFGGSGTVAVVAKKLRIPSTTIEIDPAYCELIRASLK